MVDLNHIFVISLFVLAVVSFCFLLISIPILIQLFKTLNSAQYLLDTVNDFQPTVKEIKESINSVKNVVRKSGSNVKTNLGEAGIVVISSMHGILTGFKEYLASYKISENGYNDKELATRDKKYE